MLLKSLKGLSSHTILYSLSYIASSFAGIILLPVYTRYLTKSDYGILELLSYTNTILSIIFIASFHTALGKFYHSEHDPERKKIVVSTCTIFVLVSGGIGCALCMFFDNSFSLLILGDKKFTFFIDINFLILYSDMALTISITFFIVSKKPRIYLIYNFSRLIFAIAANLYFIIVLELGALGMLYGNLVATGIAAIVLTLHNAIINGIKVDFPILKDFLKFGLPMIPAMLCATIMHNADRFLIRNYCTLADVGIYSLGYKFPFMLNALILQSFNRVWSGSAMYEIVKQPDSRYQFTKITTYFMAVFVFAQLSLSIFSVSIIRLMAAPNFFEAYQVIPPVALGICFHAFYTFFTAGAFIEQKTWILNFSYLPAAVINITGNIILLPTYGYMAAAWMTVATYLVFSVIAYLTCRQFLDVTYEYLRLAILFAVAVIICMCSLYIIFDNYLIEMFKEIMFIVIFPIILIFGGWLNPLEKNELKSAYSNIKRKIFQAN